MISLPFVVQPNTLTGGSKPKQFYFGIAGKHPQQKTENHVVPGFLSAYLLVLFSDWLVTVQLFCYRIKSWVT